MLGRGLVAGQAVSHCGGGKSLGSRLVIGQVVSHWAAGKSLGRWLVAGQAVSRLQDLSHWAGAVVSRLAGD